MPRTRILAVTSSLALVLTAACTLKVGDLGELTQSGTDPSTGSTGSTGVVTADTDDTMTGAPTTGEPLAPADGVDILFVVDNSGSMAAHQQRLAAAIPALVDPLIAAGRSLRIAVTTTDVGNPRCPATGPEKGAFQATSCRARVAEGEWTFIDEDLSAACLGVCAKDTLEFSPTVVAGDPEAKVRPWVEWDGVTGNVAASLKQALGCMLPQGVAGCGFESPLESLRLALARTQMPEDPQFGFLRSHADLLVVLVTDEMDCSSNPAFAEIFLDNKVYWNSPDDPQPTSALCMRAGVTCVDVADGFDDCVAVDHDLSGAMTDDPSQAVLFPVDRYRDALAEVRAGKLAAGSAAQVRVAAIAGVPIGYPQSPLLFDVSDPDAVANFGLDPGCVAADEGTAVPPLRILELVEDSSPPGVGVFSICEDSFQSTLAALSASLMDG